MKLKAVASLLTIIGIGLIGFGIKTYLEATGPNCDGCAPFHPLFVVAPFLVGVVLVIGGGYVFSRQ